MTSFVSIIVPIYNVENYIEQCVISLFEQDFSNIEYVFINDFTPDKSIEILESVIALYPHRQSNIKIIHHKRNKGSGAARKTGMISSTGEYVIQIDADDWCEVDMISSLYRKAKEEPSDIVVCNFYKNYMERQELVVQSFDDYSFLVKIISGELDNSCCNKLIRTRIYKENKIFPPENMSMAEDRHLIIRLSFYAQKVDYVDKAFLHYRQYNNSSLTYSYNHNSFKDLKLFIDEIDAFLRQKNVFNKYKESFYKMLMMHVLLFIEHGDLAYIRCKYPDAIKLRYIWSFSGSRVSIKLIKSIVLLLPSPFSYFVSRLYARLRRL